MKKKTPREWTPLNETCMQSGQWLIPKFSVLGKWIYVVFKGRERIGAFSTFAEAKEAVEGLTRD